MWYTYLTLNGSESWLAYIIGILNTIESNFQSGSLRPKDCIDVMKTVSHRGPIY